MRTFPTRVLPVIAVAAVLGLAACGSGSDGRTAAVASPTAPTDAPATTTAPAPTTTQKPTTTAPKPTTATAPAQGTRMNPFPVGATLKTDDYDFTVGAIEAVDPSTLPDYTQGKLEPGQVVYRTLVTADYHGADKFSGYDITFQLNLSGAKGTLYQELSVYADRHHMDLNPLTAHESVIAGGHVEGFVYYAMDGDDSAPLFVWDRSFGGTPQFLAAA
jgi:hypothetical protein